MSSRCMQFVNERQSTVIFFCFVFFLPIKFSAHATTHRSQENYNVIFSVFGLFDACARRQVRKMIFSSIFFLFLRLKADFLHSLILFNMTWNVLTSGCNFSCTHNGQTRKMFALTNCFVTILSCSDSVTSGNSYRNRLGNLTIAMVNMRLPVKKQFD